MRTCLANSEALVSATVPLRVSSFRRAVVLVFQTLHFCPVPCTPRGRSIVFRCVLPSAFSGGRLSLSSHSPMGSGHPVPPSLSLVRPRSVSQLSSRPHLFWSLRLYTCQLQRSSVLWFPSKQKVVLKGDRVCGVTKFPSCI